MIEFKFILRMLISYFYGLLNTSLNSQDLRVLMYHSIQDSSKSMWVTSSSNFTNQIQFILNKKDKFFCSCNDLLERTPKQAIAITFDDGFEDNFQKAAPLLLELGIPFCIFVVTDFINFGKKGYMDKSMLIDLAHHPLVTIGSHTKSHPRLVECSHERVREELHGSKKYLEDLLSTEIKFFSYPHGSFNEEIKNQVIDAGYKLAFTSRFDVHTSCHDKFLINRNEIWGQDNLQTFTMKINGSYDWLKFRG
jgi:peptidoglycan/xylan/chitin deacetylase (PgdA/CDA1 family)